MSAHSKGPIHVNECGVMLNAEGRGVVISGLTWVLFGTLTPQQYAEQNANRDLFVEAVNVATETGLTPSQLAEQRAGLLEALKAYIAAKREFDPDGLFDGEVDIKAKAAIAKAKGEQA